MRFCRSEAGLWGLVSKGCAGPVHITPLNIRTEDTFTICHDVSTKQLEPPDPNPSNSKLWLPEAQMPKAASVQPRKAVAERHGHACFGSKIASHRVALNPKPQQSLVRQNSI